MKRSLFLFLFIMFSRVIYCQETDISALLKDVESGNIISAEAGLKKLKAAHSGDPSVIYLDAVLSKNGKDALSKYQKVAESFPRSKYADASLYRIYSFYFASGLYNTAQKYYDQLKENYPSSVYLKQQETIVQQENTNIEEPDEEKNTPGITGTKEKSEAEPVYKFTIQTGAFLVSSNAQKLKETFEKAGYYSVVKEKKVGGSTFSVVFLGRFETEEEARAFLIDLNKRQKIEGRIVNFD